MRCVIFLLLFITSNTAQADAGYRVWVAFEMGGIKYFASFDGELTYSEEYKRYFTYGQEIRFQEELFYKLINSDQTFIDYDHECSDNQFIAYRRKHWLDMSLFKLGGFENLNEKKEYIYTQPVKLERSELRKNAKLIKIYRGNEEGCRISQLIKTSDNEWIRKDKMTLLFEDEREGCSYLFFGARGRFLKKDIDLLKKEVHEELHNNNMKEGKIFDNLYKRKIIAIAFCAC